MSILYQINQFDIDYLELWLIKYLAITKIAGCKSMNHIITRISFKKVVN
jgi:hypothetical protein